MILSLLGLENKIRELGCLNRKEEAIGIVSGAKYCLASDVRSISEDFERTTFLKRSIDKRWPLALVRFFLLVGILENNVTVLGFCMLRLVGAHLS